MSQTVFARMQQRYDTAAQWTSVNPVLLEGEIGIESDTGKFKFGDNSSNWNDLPYASTGAIDVETVQHVTASLNSEESEDFTIEAGNVFQLLVVEASTPAWIRVYGTTAARSADTRTEPGPPIPSSGAEFYAELVTTAASQAIRMSPVPIVQGTSGSAFVRISNKDAVARVITADFAFIKLAD
jgi:hypothetical protein